LLRARPPAGRRKWTDERGNLYEIVIWRVARHAHYPEGVRYRLGFIRSGEDTPALLYGNHHPKGHHRHLGDDEQPYRFVTAAQLVDDFLAQSTAIAGGVK